MTAAEFVSKWSASTLTERAGAQQHFLDVCKLVEHPEPAADDASGATFTFERLLRKKSGLRGWADVWKRGCFGWEYKGKHKNLDAAYGQLDQYRDALGNPPLLVVSDMERIVVHTNFTGTMDTPREITLADLDQGDNLAYLRKVFHKPYQLNPGTAIECVTREAASHVAGIALSMRKRGLDPQEVAHFLDRLIFCLFAEDIGLLPGTVFREIVEGARSDPEKFTRHVEKLFKAMAHGGDFGAKEISYFNGNLFNSAPVLDLSVKEITALREASHRDWSAVDPSIFGTLFERGLDPDTRAKLRAHYTSREDIEAVVEPVVLHPLRREWDQVRDKIDELMRRRTATAKRDAQDLIHGFIQRLADIRVLDPACGSGNVLYVVLLHLKDLEEEVNSHARQKQLQPCLPRVGPWQLYGIEINPYAFDLAQMTIWIGHLQWNLKKGFVAKQKPILRPIEGNFQRMDAVLDRTHPHNPREPEWPAVDFIVGNPPWVGGAKMLKTLPNDYVRQLRALFRGRLPGGADLCCYWFEKARRHVEEGKCWRAGLLATSKIRNGSNRRVLDRIIETGDIFMAWSDRPWVLDGAAVRVSMVGFDDGAETERHLDGLPVSRINPDLTSGLDVTGAPVLPENEGLCLKGVSKGGPFDLTEEKAQSMLRAPLNPNGRPNADVVRRRLGGHDIARSPRNGWVIDFVEASLEEAAGYEAPFEHMREAMEEYRRKKPDAPVRTDWWVARAFPAGASAGAAGS